MMHRFLPIALLICASYPALLYAQTATPNQIPDLEQKLAATEAPAEKAALCNELSKKTPPKPCSTPRRHTGWRPKAAAIERQ